jgi:hypothetical protein
MIRSIYSLPLLMFEQEKSPESFRGRRYLLLYFAPSAALISAA